MGYDINFYCVKEVPGSPHHYQLFAPVRTQQVSTGARAHQWEDLFHFRPAPQQSPSDLDLSWLKSHQDTPEEFDDCAPEQTFDGRGVVFEPQVILKDVLRVKTHIDQNLDLLPIDYRYRVLHHADPGKTDLRTAFRMWSGGELWSFESGWDRCEGWPITIKTHFPGSKAERFEEIPDVSRTLHGWAFPEGGLSGYVLGGYGSLFLDVRQGWPAAQVREHAGDPPERVICEKVSYAERFSFHLNSLLRVCEHALQHHCKVLVDHNV